MRKATLDHLFRHLSPVSRLVMRVDFNVPIKNQKVADPNRIISKTYIIKVPSQPFNSFSSTNLSLWYFCLIMEDLMAKEFLKILLNQLSSLSRICLEEEFIS